MISVIKAGTEYSLDDGTYCYFLGDDGAGKSPMHRLAERGPLQHGDTDRGYRLDPRILRLYLELAGTSRDNLYSKRRTLLDLFPASTQIIVKYDVGDIYYLDCYYAGDMGLPTADKDGFNQKLAVTLKANNPAFYDPAAVAVTFSLGGGADAGEVPTAIPMPVGVSTLSASNAVDYGGSLLTYPFIRITGPITDCVITNTTTGEKLDFTGTTINGGDYYDIDLRYGYKTVEDSSGTNKIADLTTDSDLSTFHLDPDPDAPSGINSITTTGSSVTGSTKVEMTFFSQYDGI